ncbi:LacI family DNA-binding transcriptional regulator [Mycolicibacterium diernhoferi]|uniref:LacI family transcriptional regulator n=2 Tax=Mycolicibacterium diernhoferi TaxID=1801 RepID=A0A1Q4HAA3_9MYCO|nr:LacI family DNA-binding transcriptional regulator [Mycolicibacterium diernhoferi]OJZ64460.1 LacI family transcriptional regulator [Mycolicibacterium diernhoferi]OPE54888.1 LacI family transcriptional regulator [Mycolicibacterium diernhoferi]QYL24284.1 LacI family DNA-binding transcriptional regulator [Mycolicibacterium diernhoferi]
MSSQSNQPTTGKPVMADVARLAGVSHQTVSRVINGSASIRPETKARVEQAISELGYRPNTAARALVTRRSGVIGIVGSNSALYGPSSIQRSVEEAARAAGYFSSMVPLAEVTREALADALDHLARQSVEAIVMIAAQEDALAVAHAADSGVPMIVVEGDLSGRGLSVGVDQIDGARQATRHLISLGHRAIDHIAGPRTWTEARGRRIGYEEAMRDAGLEVRESPVGDWTPARGYAIGCELARRSDATAVFVANDQMAIGVLHAFARNGLRVPEDVSVVGFDDLPESAYLNPALTTVRQDFKAVGQRAIELVIATLEGATLDVSLLAPELIIRESTSTPKEAR